MHPDKGYAQSAGDDGAAEHKLRFRLQQMLTWAKMELKGMLYVKAMTGEERSKRVAEMGREIRDEAIEKERGEYLALRNKFSNVGGDVLSDEQLLEMERWLRSKVKTLQLEADELDTRDREKVLDSGDDEPLLLEIEAPSSGSSKSSQDTIDEREQWSRRGSEKLLDGRARRRWGEDRQVAIASVLRVYDEQEVIISRVCVYDDAARHSVEDSVDK